MHRIVCGLAVLVFLSALCLPATAFAQDPGVDTSLLTNHVYLPVAQVPDQQPAAEGSAVRIYRTREWHDQQRTNNTGPYAGSGNLSYHGGPIMPTVKVYTIFWVPSGKTIAGGYQSLLNRYFTDIYNSSFYNVNTQYYQGSTTKTYIQNNSTYGGTYVDTTTYPHAGTKTSPLTDADIQQAVLRGVSTNHWPVNGQTSFFVFTAKGIESCYDSVDCTPGTSHPVYCAYHSNFVSGGVNYIYANMPYGESWPGSCRSFTKSPNSNLDADTEISTASHEHFESATDPNGNAWYDAAGYENGDKCAYTYGTISSNGSNVTLGGHPYIIQREWNNAGRNCVLKYP